jgi:hypothetical protein
MKGNILVKHMAVFFATGEIYGKNVQKKKK